MEEDGTVKSKLECLKETSTIDLAKLKRSLRQEVENEEKRILTYHQEMKLLLQEEMEHKEQLRQITADIKIMRNVIMQAEEDRRKHLEMAKQLDQDYKPTEMN